MTEGLFFFSALTIAYLLGSIPSSVWVGKRYFGIDVREAGSRNAGATNTFRLLGRKAGILVLTMDLVKGFVASVLPTLLSVTGLFTASDPVQFQLACGVFAVIGHILPVFAGFRGGKGVATLAGMMIAIHPAAVGLCLAVFLTLLLTFGYVSLGSMVAAIAFPIFLVLRVFGEWNSTLLIFGIVMSIAIVYTHKKNIVRLMNGEENKVFLWGRRRRV